jgi:SAM-dependent methyltransferase
VHGTRATTHEWFASWFDSAHYHALYAHRDEHEAAAFIDALVRRLQPAPGARALDLGCGAGRHARRLANAGLDVTGLDLSAASVARAQRRAGPYLRFRRHDMREPVGRGVFDYVFNLFTSFGYFETVHEHVTVLHNVSQALAAGGWFVLDYLNVADSDRRRKAFETRETDDATFRIARWTDERCFFKRIRVEDRRTGQVFEHVERVARFGVDDFARMFDAAGLRLCQLYGDYSLNPYVEADSPRLILLAIKPGEGASGGRG